MSLAKNGKDMICDGHGCNAVAHLPVALRPLLAHKAGLDMPAPGGWLCVSANGFGRHFCPSCAARFMPPLLDRERPRHTTR